MTDKRSSLALAGNPNCGKTTIFNNLTGAKQHVGNYPGVTVERREGLCRHGDRELLIVDLPGTYSLTAYSVDELVARKFIVEEKPDVVVNILDAGNLERNLYLTVQLLELERPMFTALNMADVAETMGIKINDAILKAKLGVEIVRTVGNRNKGMDTLLDVAINVSETEYKNSFKINYGTKIEQAIVDVEKLVESKLLHSPFAKRWIAIKLLENDKETLEYLKTLEGGESVVSTVLSMRSSLQENLGDDPELIMAGMRYRFVGELCKEAVATTQEGILTTSDKIDRILTNRLIGLPVFFGFMWLLFNIVFTVGAYPQDWLEQGMGLLGNYIGQYMAEGDLKSLVVDGIIGGVGSVVSFIPQILILFLGIAILEDTGYMARAAFVMDRVMKAVGLHGKSFIPLLLGFGCSLPAIMGARTLENPRDRLVTILVTPLMSCSARLPVYTVLIGAFFAEEHAGSVLFSIYFLGIFLAVLMARIFRTFLFKGEAEPFVMELPPYRIPTLKSILLHMWERGSLYMKKAGTIILAVSILVWFLANYPNDVEYSKKYQELNNQAEAAFTQQVGYLVSPLGIQGIEEHSELKDLVEQMEAEKAAFEKKTGELEENSDKYVALAKEKEEHLKVIEEKNPELFQYASQYAELKNALDEQKDTIAKEEASEKIEQSYAGKIGHAIEPLIRPLGFDWKIGIGLVTALSAKEVLVSTLGTIYSVGEVEDDTMALQDALKGDPHFNPVVAYGLMAFVLIYPPCLATIAIIRKETGSLKWTFFSIAYSTTLAWIVSFIIYQAGSIFGF